MKKIYLKSLVCALLVALSCTNVKAVVGIYYLKSAGAVGLLASWGENTDGTGTAPASFTNTGHIWHFANRASLTLSSNFGPPSQATVVIDANFNLTTTTVFGVLNENLQIASAGTLTIGNNNVFNFNNLDPNSTVVYNFTSNTVKAANYGNLTIAASTSLVASGVIYTYGLLTINGTKTLTMNGNGLYLQGSNGTIAGAGFLKGDANAFIQCLAGNGGNNGTFNFSGGGAILDYFYLQYNSAADYTSLGTDLTITFGAVGTFFQALGSLNLNDKTLTVDNTSDASFAVVATDGVIMGSANSALILNGTIGVFSGSSDMFMDPANNTLKRLVFNGPSQTLNAANALKIADSLSVLDGTFNANGFTTLLATSALKGRLGRVGGTISGNITVQTFAKAGVTDWTNLGVTGVNGQTFASWDGQIPMSCVGCINDEYSAGGYFVSIQSWDETAVAGSSVAYIEEQGTNALPVGKGYWIFLGTALNNSADITYAVTGTAVQGGTATIALTNSGVGNGDGFNLISNPLASPISWAALLATASASVDNAIYIYNPDVGPTSFVGGVSTPGGAGSANNVIPAGQGFYVRCSAASANLTALESIKVTNNTSANELLKTNNVVSEPDVFRLRIDEWDGYFDETALHFVPNSSHLFDSEWDAYKLFASPGYLGYPGAWTQRTSISSQFYGVDYSINSIPLPASQSLVMPILAKVYASGQVTISPIGLENLPAGACANLYDKVTNINHDLTTGQYVCSINDTTSKARFVLTICGTATPPAGITQNNMSASNIAITNDATGALINLDFAQVTKATISVTNVLGQKIIKDKTITAYKDAVHIDLSSNNELLFVTVTTDNERITKKIIR